MKKSITALLLALALSLCLTGCKGNTDAPASTTEPQQTATETPSESSADATAAAEQPTDAAGGKTLVVYFSATGTTRGVAETIAKLTNADLFEITPAQPYTDADLNWSDRNSRSTKEQNDPAARPAIAGAPLTLDGYTTVYIGYPIWWGEEPRILDTFVESHDFTGLTMIPFCTSSSSGIGRSGRNLEEHAGTGTWLDGKRFSAGATEADLQAWIEALV